MRRNEPMILLLLNYPNLTARQTHPLQGRTRGRQHLMTRCRDILIQFLSVRPRLFAAGPFRTWQSVVVLHTRNAIQVGWPLSSPFGKWLGPTTLYSSPVWWLKSIVTTTHPTGHTKRVYKSVVGGSWGRGKPSKEWMNGVKDAVKRGMTVENSKVVCQNRS